MSDIERIDVPEFHARLKAQGASARHHIAFKCPMCETVQSATSLIRAGAGEDMEAVEKYLGFSCVGRFMNAESPRKKPDGKPCNWTLGGLFKLHKMEVVDQDGKVHPHFQIASSEEAAALEASHG